MSQLEPPLPLDPESAEALLQYFRRKERGEEVDLDAYCDAHPEIADELRQCEAGGGAGTLGPLDAADEAPGVWRDVVARLTAQGPPRDRYEPLGEIGAGGMGRVLEVWDRDLGRRVAMKVAMHTGPVPAASPDDPLLGRFLEEAQVTAQLDHPGIVPVHELGIDAGGHVYFTMKLVKGTDLRAVFGKVWRGEDGWTQTRAVAVLLRVCEAMAFAHSRHVLHRDLKPANVMVGRFGEVHVMDWGLARLLSTAQGRPAVAAAPSVLTRLWTVRKEAGQQRPDAPILTLTGDTVGTPPFMSPEQARGELELLGPAADVYSLGAILYELLTGQMPYVAPGTSPTPLQVLDRVRQGPPAKIDQIARAVPVELVAICEKAMARDPDARYAGMEAMADDLRAYLENRVVRAHRTGAVVELRKWIGRNRAVAASLAALLVVVVGAALLVAAAESARAEGIARMADAHLAGLLIERTEDLGPIHPDNAERRTAWLAEAEALLATQAGVAASLDELRRAALPVTPEEIQHDWETHPLRPKLQQLGVLVGQWESARKKRTLVIEDPATAPRERQKEIERREIFDGELERARGLLPILERRVGERRTWRFEDRQLQKRHDALGTLAANLEQLREVAARVREDLARGQTLRTAGNGGDESWQVAIATIAGLPDYRGLQLSPQMGLVPLGVNRQGRYEFWHVLSGDRPERGASGELVVEPRTGIVLVLLPGGSFLLGAQSSDENAPGYDSRARANERPPRPVDLVPFFVSKYELTQGQWRRATGDDPSALFAGADDRRGETIGLTNPVENITWHEARRVLDRWGLSFPTEAQLEYAARAGGPELRDPVLLAPLANHFAGSDAGPDGRHLHAPVGTYPPNGSGLYDVLGNVREWCQDWYASSYDEDMVDVVSGTGLLQPRRFIVAVTKSVRGGSYRDRLDALRSSCRFDMEPAKSDNNVGVRPARPLYR